MAASEQASLISLWRRADYRPFLCRRGSALYTMLGIGPTGDMVGWIHGAVGVSTYPADVLAWVWVSTVGSH